MQYGLDTNGDNTLADGEVLGTAYICTPPSPAGTHTNGAGGTYTASGADETANAKLACESVHGVGQCCNDGCGSCNNRGYHKCGTPNCNGSVYWNYADNTQSMGCGWVDPAEIIISIDGKNWVQ